MDKKKFILLITGEIIYHGDYIVAFLGAEHDDNRGFVTGRLCINEYMPGGRPSSPSNCFICQDSNDGDEGACDKFGYQYSWTFSLNEDGKLSTTDTQFISKSFPSREEFLRLVDIYKQDDSDERDDEEDEQETIPEPPANEKDKMPEDWVVDEKIPDNL